MAADPLAGRVARFGELRGNPDLFLDTAIPAYARTVWSLIGPNVGEDAGDAVAVPPDGFNLAVIHAEPDMGAGLHDHTTVEVFMALEGRWAIVYGAEGEHELVLERFDVVSVPPGLMRGFRNAGTEAAHLLAVVGGTDAGRLTWHPRVIEEAHRHGRSLDERGFIVDR